MPENANSFPENYSDLIMYQCGTEVCRPGHSYGPAIRDHFLIHYIHSGRGVFTVNGHTYHLCQNQGFLICPGVITFYQADQQQPWHYSWVGFQGLKALSHLEQAGLRQETPIFVYDRDNMLAKAIIAIINSQQISKGRESRELAYLYLFLSLLIETGSSNLAAGRRKNHMDLYIHKAIEFISMNYSRKLLITEVSHYVGLERSYFCSLFKKHLQVSPQYFLLQYRMEKACKFMKNNALSIGDIARSVGYDDPLLFSKIFKRIKGLSPREYRKNIKD